MGERTKARGQGPSQRRQALGRAIRSARWPMTQADVGAAVGRPQSCVSTWENGRIELGVDRVLELDRLFGRAAGTLLLESGYVSREAVRRVDMCRTFEAEEGHDTGPGAMDDYPELAVAWLAEYEPLVDAAVILRRLGTEPEALAALLASRPLTQLRLSWEIWGHLREVDVRSTRAPGRPFSQQLADHCREALWGDEPDDRAHIRLVAR